MPARLEVLEDLDVARRLVKEGVQAPRFTHPRWQPHAAPDRLQRAADGLPVHADAAAVAAPSDCCSTAWSNSAGRAPAEDADHDRAGRRRRDGRRSTTATPSAPGYVVGADGMRSTVREQAGIGFAGGAYDESFVLADVRLSGDAPARRGHPVLGDGRADGGGAAARRRAPHRRAGGRRARVAVGAVHPGTARHARARRRADRSSRTWCGAHASGSTTGSPTRTGRAGCCSPATPRTCTARPAGRA